MLLFDNRGIGGSDTPPGPYTAAAMAGDALQVLDEAGVERAHVLGTSLGGMVAQELALAAPDRVDRLVLACTTPGGAAARTRCRPTTLELLHAWREPPRATSRTRSRPAVAAELVDRILVHREAEAQPYDAWAAQAAAGAAFDAYDRLGASRRADARAPRRRGHRRRRAQRGAARRRCSRMPASPIYEGLGHLFFWSEPERFAREVEEFLC